MQKIVNVLVRLLAFFGVKVVALRRYNGPKSDMDADFLPLYEACKPYTLIHVERMYSLYKAVEYIVKKGIPGDIVECGVWKGGAAMMIAKTLLFFGDTKRKIYLYDTYQGMSKPTAEDRSVVSGTTPVAEIWQRNQSGDHNEWCYGPLDGVKKVMQSTGYPADQIVYVQGMVENTIPKTMPGNLAMLRLDTDWYRSTLHELEHLFPNLQTGGVIILDDYGYWAGARQAADEYFSKNNLQLFLHRDDDSGVTGIRN